MSCSRGKLHRETASQLIRIYIKNIDNLEKCLSDKFRLKVFCILYAISIESTSPDNVVLIAKLKVLMYLSNKP